MLQHKYLELGEYERHVVGREREKTTANKRNWEREREGERRRGEEEESKK